MVPYMAFGVTVSILAFSWFRGGGWRCIFHLVLLESVGFIWWNHDRGELGGLIWAIQIRDESADSKQ